MRIMRLIRCCSVALTLIPTVGCTSLVDADIRRETAIEQREGAASQQKALELVGRLMQGNTPLNFRAQATAYLKSNLKDPYSARISFAPPKGPLVCGLLNAKNSFGAYSGATPFYIVFGETGAIKRAVVFEGAEEELLVEAQGPHGIHWYTPSYARVDLLMFQSCASWAKMLLRSAHTSNAPTSASPAPDARD